MYLPPPSAPGYGEAPPEKSIVTPESETPDDGVCPRGRAGTDDDQNMNYLIKIGNVDENWNAKYCIGMSNGQFPFPFVI